MRMKALFFAGFLVFSAAARSAPPKSAEDVPAEEMARRIEESKKKVEAEEMARRKVLSALYELNKKIRRTVSEKSKLKVERIGVEENIRRIEARLTETQEISDRMRARLAERLRVLHRLGGASVARILFSAGNSSQLERNLRILGAISSRDRDAVQEYQRGLKEISERKARLAQRAGRLKKLESEVKDREQRWVREQNTKNKLLGGIRRKHLFALQDLRKLKEQTLAAGFADEGLLDALLKPSFAEQKGKLPPPLPRAVLSRRFGVEKAGENSWTIVHKGMRWVAPRGSPVQAVFDGTVVWVGKIGKSGTSIIVDHGDHYYTVYSELEKSLVTEGQEIRQNQILAAVGQSSLEETPGLHFEIRHFSEPDDPQPWMKGNVL